MSRVRLTRLEQLGRRIADLLQGHHGSLSDLPGGGTNESHGPSMLHEEAHRVRGVQQHPRQMPTEQRQGHIEGLDLGLCGQFDLGSMQQVRQDQAGPDLLVDHPQFGTPQQGHLQVLFEFAKGQFNLPSARVQPRDVDEGEGSRVEHIGQIAVLLGAAAKADQAHQLARPIGRMPPQRDQGIENPIGLIQDMHHLVARLGALAREVPIASLGQLIPPGKTEVAQIKEQQAACGQSPEHGPRMHFAVGGGIQQHVEPHPLLQAHVKEAHQPSGKQATVALRHLAQPVDPALDAIQPTLIQSHYPVAKGAKVRSS